MATVHTVCPACKSMLALRCCGPGQSCRPAQLQASASQWPAGPCCGALHVIGLSVSAPFKADCTCREVVCCPLVPLRGQLVRPQVPKECPEEVGSLQQQSQRAPCAPPPQLLDPLDLQHLIELRCLFCLSEPLAWPCSLCHHTTHCAWLCLYEPLTCLCRLQMPLIVVWQQMRPHGHQLGIFLSYCRLWGI